VTPEGIERYVEQALEDKVKGIIFEIDSPGGVVVPSAEITRYVKEIELPKVALVRGYPASGAYEIASGCDKIVAHEYSLVGSISVILAHVEISKLAERHGIGYDGVQAGQYKDMGNIFRPFTKEERKILKEAIGIIEEMGQFRR